MVWSIDAFQRSGGMRRLGLLPLSSLSSLFSLLSISALCGCVSPDAGASPPSPSIASAITGIALERDCSGCPTGSVLTLGRDGTASYTLTGKARLGTEDQRFGGSLRPEDFDQLARLAVAQGFFEMRDDYADPQLQDGPWATLSIARGEQEKRVFRRGDAGPAALKTLEAAIEALRLRIKFAPDRR